MGGTKTTESVMLEVEHVQQQHTWDCGLACIMMVLQPRVRAQFSDALYQICQEEGIDKSTWTIDLAYLLQRYGVKHRYLTITLGVDLGFSSERFYDQYLHKDTQRVLDRFQEADQRGVVVEQGAASISDLQTHLRLHGPIIILTNAHLLACLKCTYSVPHLRSCLPCSPPYQGHFILLIGYDARKGHMYYRNPSFRSHVCTITFAKLDLARRSYGTDEDIVFIYSDLSRKLTGNNNSTSSSNNGGSSSSSSSNNSIGSNNSNNSNDTQKSTSS
ncbi:hypothetical protein Pmani_036140 [Petrolisthes manimaculis]|uniref:Protein GUCD1 n=1 Tax=Petrolisthes manimaculis TaxID=1843537 RepID=A0AAE1NIZ6_9EUCA|nr:hypothetical protein Pmani_036140 [Petrolisthes manimaculis]